MVENRSSPAKMVRSPHHRVSGDFPIVGIGASAGGLDACRKMLGAIPAHTGMAFILVQHLDPHHESMMADLLAGHTPMTVRQAADGMSIERDHLYLIPPGVYLSVVGLTLHLSQPQARHGARMPFDFFLQSLAEDCGARAVCVVLSGTGGDGSLGLKAVKEKSGLVIAQDPGEADFDGMPRSAIATGGVDFVLRAAEIPAALIRYGEGMVQARAHKETAAADSGAGWLPEIIELLRTRTVHDFTLYKLGTLQRRIERRMAMASLGDEEWGRYLAVLRTDTSELDRLANDLLISVTGFFRDPKVFENLAAEVVPEIVRAHDADHPVRIWSAGCSTGEEAYSLAILFSEGIVAAESAAKLQVFASDIDPAAVAAARAGFYPETIAADLSPERLARFFAREDGGYRVLPELRDTLVFTTQDVLTDPPFSRLDLISCRNLLIYLRPEAQERVISLFHFALRERGLLLLGSSETVGTAENRFEVVSKSDRLYRHIGGGLAGGPEFPAWPGDVHASARLEPRQAPPARPMVLADLCRKLVLESYAPAVALINRKGECLYFLGPVGTYLSVKPGQPVQDLLAMVCEDVRNKLRLAIRQACRENAQAVIPGGRLEREGGTLRFRIEVRPVVSEGEDLLLVGFIDEPGPPPRQNFPAGPGDAPPAAEIEQELEATRTELQAALRSLEILGEEQKAINEESSSVQEEYQSTNEELMTSKEELQSLNEELTALNTQLQEALEQQRSTSDDLQNILYSTNVATIFLDNGLNIRFFTPATKALFNVIPGDVGRPLADLNSLAVDETLLRDAETVLRNLAPIEREIETRNGTWFIRRILPYRTQDGGVEGVVITFADSTERKHAADALEEARRQAQQANTAKSRFLAAASHDLRQPLQTLALLHGLLAKTVEGEKGRSLVARLDETMGAVSSMLNTLLDINQIEAGTVQAEIVDFPIAGLLARMHDAFVYHAEAQGLSLRVVPCGLSIRSDPRLLEQMIRNLLSNALKYTRKGKVLLGCRRRQGYLRLEIWDTGIGIPEEELQAIFEEYHQIDNAARERSLGLGLGLSIVQRLANLLGHRVEVRSRPESGSVFAIEVKLPPDTHSSGTASRPHASPGPAQTARRTGDILIVEDDPEVRGLLDLALQGDGHRTATAADGIAALELVGQGDIRPDLILADYNLPKGLNGLEAAAKLRESAGRRIPVIILTGDISTGSLRDIARQDCVQVNKPVKLTELMRVVQHGLEACPAPLPVPSTPVPAGPVIFVIDDDNLLRAGIRETLEANGHTVEDFATGEDFLAAYHPGGEACLLVDAYLPGMSGLELLRRLRAAGHRLPSIMITGSGDVPLAVEAMKAGAMDFIEKPIGSGDLLAGIGRALEQSRDAAKLSAWRKGAADHIGRLTPRQREIMDRVLAGHPSKNIAADLGISQRTVENHRAAVMRRTGAKSLPALARLAVAAATDAEPPNPAPA